MGIFQERFQKQKLQLAKDRGGASRAGGAKQQSSLLFLGDVGPLELLPRPVQVCFLVDVGSYFCVWGWVQSPNVVCAHVDCCYAMLRSDFELILLGFLPVIWYLQAQNWIFHPLALKKYLAANKANQALETLHSGPLTDASLESSSSQPGPGGLRPAAARGASGGRVSRYEFLDDPKDQFLAKIAKILDDPRIVACR